MINLLPPHPQSRIRKEYWIRVGSVWALLISCVCVITILLLLPSYVLLKSSIDALALELRDSNEAEEKFIDAESGILFASAFAKQLSIKESPVQVTDIVTTVTAAAGGQISLQSFEINRDDVAAQSIQVQGTALSRESLTEFKSALEREALFSSASVPISDLARDQDLPFVLTLTIAPIRR